MGDWTITLSQDFIYYLIIPILIPVVPWIVAVVKRREMGVSQSLLSKYVLEELKEDVKELKDRITRLEELSLRR